MHLGASRVVLPAAFGAHQIANVLTAPSADQLFRSGHQRAQLAAELEEIDLKLTELPVPDGSAFVGRPWETSAWATRFSLLLSLFGLDAERYQGPETKPQTAGWRCDCAACTSRSRSYLASRHSSARVHLPRSQWTIVRNEARAAGSGTDRFLSLVLARYAFRVNQFIAEAN